MAVTNALPIRGVNTEAKTPPLIQGVDVVAEWHGNGLGNVRAHFACNRAKGIAGAVIVDVDIGDDVDEPPTDLLLIKP
ncbi:hypothetical protein D9M69_442900 [compost metagenome]